ncbi:MAG: molybdopterin-dependent oxidoreductase, partial [Selenomonas sp.]|nr:molybdopterin-dependent oxidoreductase [Selenomonas sp.]
MEIKKSACPYDCPDCCGLLVTIENGRAVKVSGDPEHPFTRGTLCPKMAHYERTVHSPKRLTTPLKRLGAKGEGKFTPLSWEEAIKTIASRWQEIIRSDGAEAILPYSYAGTMGILQHDACHALFYALGATSLDRTLCAPAKGQGYKAVMGSTLTTAPQEAQDSDFILLWSLSMLATDIHFKHDVDRARKNGARVLCID